MAPHNRFVRIVLSRLNHSALKIIIFPLQRESPDFLARERHRHVPGHLHLPRVQRTHGVRGHPPAPQEAPKAESAGMVVDFILSLGHMFFLLSMKHFLLS